MRRRSRSSDEIQKLSSELDWTEEIMNNTVLGGGDCIGGVSRARSSIVRRRSMLSESFKKNHININLNINNDNDNDNGAKLLFSKNNGTRKTISSSNTDLTLTSSIKFPLEAFTVDNSTEFRNPDLFSEVYSMAYISACELSY